MRSTDLAERNLRHPIPATAKRSGGQGSRAATGMNAGWLLGPTQKGGEGLALTGRLDAPEWRKAGSNWH